MAFADPKVDFPITEGAYKDEEDRRLERKSFKAVVTKLRPDGRSIVYSTCFPVLITNIVAPSFTGAVYLAGLCARYW